MTVRSDLIFFWSHVASAFVHLTSASVIAIIGTRGKHECFNRYGIDVLPWGHIRRWKYVCPEDYTTFVCAGDKRAYYSDPLWTNYTGHPCHAHGTLGDVNVLAMAISFALVSGTMHLTAVFIMEYSNKRTLSVQTASFLRWLDYSVSAPLMLAVVGILFSASNFYAVALAPGALSVLLIIAGFIEPGEPIEKRSAKSKKSNWVLFAIISVAYIFTWLPVYLAVRTNTDPVKPHSGVDNAPRFVTTMLWIIFSIFLFFPIVYALDYDYGGAAANRAHGCQRRLIGWLGGRERLYITLSMIAKVTLHVFLALSLFAQSKQLKRSSKDALLTGADNMIERDAVWGAVGVVVGSIVLNSLIIPCAVGRRKPPTPKVVAPSKPKERVYAFKF